MDLSTPARAAGAGGGGDGRGERPTGLASGGLIIGPLIPGVLLGHPGHRLPRPWQPAGRAMTADDFLRHGPSWPG